MALDLLFSWISTCFHIKFKTVFKTLDHDLNFVQCCIWGNTPTFCDRVKPPLYIPEHKNDCREACPVMVHDVMMCDQHYWTTSRFLLP